MNVTEILEKTRSYIFIYSNAFKGSSDYNQIEFYCKMKGFSVPSVDTMICNNNNHVYIYVTNIDGYITSSHDIQPDELFTISLINLIRNKDFSNLEALFAANSEVLRRSSVLNKNKLEEKNQSYWENIVKEFQSNNLYPEISPSEDCTKNYLPFFIDGFEDNIHYELLNRNKNVDVYLHFEK